MSTDSIDLGKVRVRPLSERRSLTRVEDILVAPDSPPPPCDPERLAAIRQCAGRVRQARRQGAAVLLMYGAHLLRNGAAPLLERLMSQGWLTHLATHGAGSIHDFEYSFLGRSTESVRENVATGTFGAWEETGRLIQLALMAGALRDPAEGYGRALGRLIWEEGVEIPSAASLQEALRARPGDPRSAARADFLQAVLRHGLAPGRLEVAHRWKASSILGQAFRHGVPATVHPGIGYDITTVHPMFNGAVAGRGAHRDFEVLGGTLERLDGGVVLSVGSAVMAPQVFEKCLSCVNNLRLQSGRPVVRDHFIQVVDLQEGGRWDWSQGEPPKTSPDYYLRFCKSFSRMGGCMRYLQCDNVLFIHQLFHELSLEP